MTRVTLPARLLLNPDDKNYSNVIKSFGLSTKKIEMTKDNRTAHLNIIAFPELVKDGRRSFITFVLHKDVWHAMLDFSKGHRTFSIPTYIRLTSKYAVILYLLVSNQTTPKSYTIGYLRHLLGVQNMRSYERGANFVARILDPAREELMSKAPYYFDYSCNKTGSSQKITEIIIIPQTNTIEFETDEEVRRTAAELRLRCDDDVRIYIQERFGMQPQSLDRLERLLLRVGDKDKIMTVLQRINEQVLQRRVRNKSAYLARSIHNLFRQS